MTQKVFTNKAKVTELTNQLHKNAILSDSEIQLNTKKIVLQLQETSSGWRPRGKGLYAFSALVAAGAVFLFTLYMFFWHHPLPPVSSETSLSSKESEPMPIQGLVSSSSVASLPLYQSLAIPKDAGAKFIMTNRTTIWTHSETELTFVSKYGDITIDHGRLLANYTERSHSTLIRTPNGEIEIIGTVFSVTATAHYLTIRLFEGTLLLHLKGITETVKGGNLIQIKNKIITERRPLDRSDVISALLITEKTVHLDGPPVPELQISRSPDPPTTSDTEKKPGACQPRQKKTKEAPKHSSQAKKTEEEALGAAPVEFHTPPKDDMIVENIKIEDSKAGGNVPTADELLKDACRNLRSGDHEQGKKQIKQYLNNHPDDRYWDHVHSIFE